MTQDQEKNEDAECSSKDGNDLPVTVTPQKPGLFSSDTAVSSAWKTPVIRAPLKNQTFNPVRSVGGSTSSSCGSGIRQNGVYLTPKRLMKTDSPLNTNIQRFHSSESSSSSCHTPPNRIFNPFEAYSTDSLHLSSFSPSVFATVYSPGKQAEKPFRWSIDQLALLTPADIDEHSLQELMVVKTVDSEQEKKAQEAIVKFFSQDSIVPSPWLESNKASPPPVTERPEAAKTTSKNAWCQTAISIPTNLDLDTLLGMFNTVLDEDQAGGDVSIDEDMRCSNLSTSLRRKLFSHLQEGQDTSMSDSLMSVEDTATIPHQCTITSDGIPMFTGTPPKCSNSPDGSPALGQFSSSPASSERAPFTRLTPPWVSSPQVSPISMYSKPSVSDPL